MTLLVMVYHGSSSSPSHPPSCSEDVSESLLTSSFTDNWELAAKTPTTPKGRLAAKKSAEDVWAGVKTGSVYSSEVGVYVGMNWH